MKRPPGGAVFKNRVEDGEQLAHAGYQRYHLRFAPGAQSLVELLDGWLKRVATRAPMYKTSLTRSRPPHIVRRPRSVPESRLRGATPTKKASCLGLSSPLPSSGNSLQGGS